MSKISLSPSPTGSAVYTIASPAGSTDRTLTLPDNTGTVITTASTGAVTDTMLASAAVTQAKLATLVVPIGVGQSWQNVAGSRSAGVTYTNTSGRPILVQAGQTSFTGRTLTVDGLAVSTNSGDTSTVSAVVPNGSTYSINFGVTFWFELR